MMNGRTDHIASATVEPTTEGGTELTIAHADLRRALIRAIARRAGKTLLPISLQEAYSDIPLAKLYQSKLHTNWFVEVVGRFLFRRLKTG